MVGVSAGIAVLAGVPLAVFPVTSGPQGIFPAPRLNRVLGTLVNGFRAVPFIVLLVTLILLVSAVQIAGDVTLRRLKVRRGWTRRRARPRVRTH